MVSALAALSPIDGSRLLIGVALVLQTAELLYIRASFTDTGVWSWEELRREYSGGPRALQKFLDRILAYRPFFGILLLRLVASGAILFTSNPFVLSFLLFTTIAIAIRWRGTFNGGSDYMTAVVLIGLILSSTASRDSLPALVGVYYVAVQTCLSYLIAGVTKLRAANWRSGEALRGFLCSTIYADSPALNKCMNVGGVAPLLAWTLILFECTFPIALFDQTLCAIYLGAGVLFHLVNSYLFGLNRFFWAWISAYPMIWLCSGVL